jgi:UDPglucose 6-dehydrogenase
MRIVEAVVAVNEHRKRAMARKVASLFGGTGRGKIVTANAPLDEYCLK